MNGMLQRETIVGIPDAGHRRFEELITLQTACRVTGMSEPTVRKLANGEWSAFTLRIGRRYRISRAGLEAWITESMGNED